MVNETIITKSKELYTEVFYSQLSEIDDLNYWSNEDAFWRGKEQSLERIEALVRPYSWWRDNCSTISKEATDKFQKWLQKSSLSSPFNSIDEKGRLYEPFSIKINQMLESEWHWIVSYTHPITREKVVRLPIGSTHRLECSDLNNILPKDMLFFADKAENIHARLLAIPTDSKW